MLDMEQIVDKVGKAYPRMLVMHGASFHDARTILMIPTRGTMNSRCVDSVMRMLPVMNQPRIPFICSGHEVGRAYNQMVATILAHPDLSKFPFVMTIEDDMIVPPDAHIRLLESMEEMKLDAVSGLYFTKGDFNAPMAYGNPLDYARTGVLDFKPFPPEVVREAMNSSVTMPVNGIAMGCALWRMDLFREIAGPWFVTCNDIYEGATKVYTQDLYFCERAVREKGKRFAVDFRVRCGHMDVASGEVY